MKKSIKLGVLLGLAACMNVAYAQTNTIPITLAEIAGQQNGKTFNDWEASLYCTYLTNGIKIHIVAQAGKVQVAPVFSNVIWSSTAVAAAKNYGGNIPYIHVLQIPGVGKEGDWKQYTQGKFENPTGSDIKATYTPGGMPAPAPWTGVGRPPLNTGPVYVYTQAIATNQTTNNVSHYNFSINTSAGMRNIALFPNGYYVSIGNSAKYIPGC